MSIDPPSQDGPAGAAVIRPDQDMVRRLLEQMELKYLIDEDGDLVTPWEGFRVYLMFSGESRELFSVRSYYDTEHSLDAKPQLLELVDEWNRDTLWPKVYTHTSDDGVVRLIGEATMPIGSGVAAEHFVSSVATWIQAAVDFAQWTDKRLGA